MRQLSCKNDLSAFGATLGKLGQLYIPSSGHTGLVSTGFLSQNLSHGVAGKI